MQRKLSVRIIASLILSVMLFALPVGAFIANSSTAVSVYAEESVTGNEAGTTDDSSSSDDASDRGSTDEGTDTTVENPSSGDNSDAEDTSNTGDSASEYGAPVTHFMKNSPLYNQDGAGAFYINLGYTF